MLTLKACAKALSDVFDENMTVEELLDAMKAKEIADGLILEDKHDDLYEIEIPADLLQPMTDDFDDLCDELKEKYNVDLKEAYSL